MYAIRSYYVESVSHQQVVATGEIEQMGPVETICNPGGSSAGALIIMRG